MKTLTVKLRRTTTGDILSDKPHNKTLLSHPPQSRSINLFFVYKGGYYNIQYFCFVFCLYIIVKRREERDV